MSQATNPKGAQPLQRPCYDWITTNGWPGGLSGRDKWLASLFFAGEYEAMGFTPRESEAEIRAWREGPGNRPFRTPSEFRSEVVRGVDKVFNRTFRRFSCSKFVEFAPESCRETRGEVCAWKQAMDGYVPKEEWSAALLEARRQWDSSGWREYLFREFGPKAHPLIWFYEGLGIYAAEKGLSADYRFNLGVRTWIVRIERSQDHQFSIRQFSWAQRTLDELGLIVLEPAQDTGPPILSRQPLYTHPESEAENDTRKTG